MLPCSDVKLVPGIRSPLEIRACCKVLANSGILLEIKEIVFSVMPFDCRFHERTLELADDFAHAFSLRQSKQFSGV